MRELRRTLALSWHVVVRNWVVYRKDFLANISPTIADPALMLGALGIGLSPFIGEIDGLTYAQFLAPGMIATTALFTAFFECSYGFYVKMTFESVFKAMLTTPIGVREVVIGEYLWVFVRAALMAAGVAVFLLLFGLLANPLALPLFALIGGLLAIPCGGIGLLSAAWVRNINQFQTVYSFLIAPIFFLSGVFFPLADRPVLGAIVQVSPFYHGVRLLQMTAWDRWDPGEALYHLGALIAFSILLGWISYRWIARKLTT